MDVDNYYQSRLDEIAQYHTGDLFIKASDAWGPRDPPADMPFRIYSDDIIETSQQISTFASNYGQFLKGIRIDNQSGLYTASARDGNANAYFEVTELMKMGSIQLSEDAR